MKVLMFGWEFPPKIYGGLAVASYGITKGLSLQGDVETTFCLPKPSGQEEKFLNIIGMNQVPIVWRDVNYDYLKSRLPEYMTPEQYYAFRDHIYADFSYMHVNDLGCMEFAGGYPAGVHAKMVSGKPLCIHVHATDFDRSRGKVNPTVYAMEKNGMDHADCIMCVSELTRRTVINEYHQNPNKVFAVHNAVYPLSQDLQDIPRVEHPKEKIVTFLGRITMQKGPEYFVEAAALVLKRTRNIRFVMAGSGDMLNAMINLAAERGIADRFHFPGFQRGRQVYEAYKNSDVFVMPSVSEPFGIAPLEAMQCGTPSIISKQSGCGEILENVIKTDYWDINAMADAIYAICTYPSLFKYLQEEGRKEVDGITWEKVGWKIRGLYEDVLRNYAK